ncbi:DUF4870 domain-containing protein [Microbacterium sp. NPDC089320]|uniref:DUF4870 domain-containing protein n=1 Tax=Microbacterium sp. NPDC089320 TaxID=3155182 RepID=UPI00342F2095
MPPLPDAQESPAPAPPPTSYAPPPAARGSEPDAYAPPQAPGYAPPQAPGYAPPQAPGYASPQAPGYAPQQPAGYAPPAYPAQGYPVGAYPVAVPPRGLLPWALGLLILIPFPFVGGLASGLAMALSGGTSRRYGGVARENARAALNWGLTYLLVSTVLLITHFVLLFALTSDSPASGFYPLGIPITLYFALSVLHLVLVVVGMVRASSGKVVRVPFAIPYLRA